MKEFAEEESCESRGSSIVLSEVRGVEISFTTGLN